MARSVRQSGSNCELSGEEEVIMYTVDMKTASYTSCNHSHHRNGAAAEELSCWVSHDFFTPYKNVHGYGQEWGRSDSLALTMLQGKRRFWGDEYQVRAHTDKIRHVLRIDMGGPPRVPLRLDYTLAVGGPILQTGIGKRYYGLRVPCRHDDRQRHVELEPRRHLLKNKTWGVDDEAGEDPTGSRFQAGRGPNCAPRRIKIFCSCK
jgi:hypothetical protein